MPSQASIEPAGILLAPADYCDRLDWRDIFGRLAPVEVDVGCGDGGFLLEMARRHPGHDFLGIERLLGRIRKVCRRAAHGGLRNVRALRLETTYAVKYLLPPASIATIHVAFPDPWPKTRHHKRRLVSAGFLADCAAALAPGGELRIKTDHTGYFQWLLKHVPAQDRLQPADWPDEAGYPLTDFERQFAAEGRAFHRLRLVKRD